MPNEGGSEAFEVSVTGGPISATGSADLVVWLNWKAAPAIVEFFPDPGSGLKVEGARARTRGNLTRVDLTISRLKTSAAPAESLRALIVTQEADGNRQAKVVHIAID